MINKIYDVPSFSLFNNFEIIKKLKYKVNEIIDKINEPAPEPTPSSDVIYSYEERKIGSYFGFDLYEKCIDVTGVTTGEESNVNIEIEGANIVVSAVLNINDQSSNHFESNISTTVYQDSVVGFYAIMHDYEDAENIGSVLIMTPENETTLNGFLKVQYTKVIS